MEKLIIIGASGMGKEAVWIAESMGVFKEILILDDSLPIATKTFSAEVHGKIQDSSNFKDYSFVIAIGNPRTRRLIYQKLITLGITKFTNLIHSKALIAPGTKIGAGNIIGPGAIVSVDVEIGNFTIINNNTCIAHDCFIDDFCTIAPSVAISGNVKLNPLVEIGTNASVRQGLIIQRGCLLGMGSVLTKNINQENQIFIGSPARFLKTVESIAE